ncbi:5'-nucleotidase /3'-nucleotidase /exopolyphosphatase [Thermanaeromonas toyohensis ToBE]|uniref:5'-nucleotidase SurE n=1 Tax=Thermanaeromonas toyohensis ToBE TaxID=698762 RepID=A0A1W1VWZ0_9FIRM|nr:5'/3'-nucleotidase SurE [Thermanaeromonas toyohensis]SMB97887.1 5'-nucleotidase /3'-nucleotidase /exopolyphosphatase [Thermanaeromonas toyohensis ToBE]
MLFLLTNDDGIAAEGLRVLGRKLASRGQVFIVAPERERSAIGHGITMHKPLRVTEVELAPDLKGFAVNGTPADCVKLALEALLPQPPDVVVSGINRGENLGTDVLYSGTVSGAIEGCINGIPSLAVSLAGEKESDYSFAAAFTASLCQYIAQRGLPPGTFLNVNIPNLPPEDISGIALTRLGQRRYINTIERRIDPRGKAYFWLAGEVKDLDADPDTDIGALLRKFISITPLHLDLTDHRFLEQLRGEFPLLQGLNPFPKHQEAGGEGPSQEEGDHIDHTSHKE